MKVNMKKSIMMVAVHGVVLMVVLSGCDPERSRGVRGPGTNYRVSADRVSR